MQKEKGQRQGFMGSEWYHFLRDQLRDPEVLRETLLLRAKELTATELALTRMGVNRYTRPDQIPGVNTVQNFTPFLRETVGAVAIVGMPHAGKDTVIAELKELEREGLFFSEEPYQVAKKLGREKRPFFYGVLAESILAASGQIDLALIELVWGQKGQWMFNRSLTDHLVWARALFLASYISARDLTSLTSVINREMNPPHLNLDGAQNFHHPLATFVFMITPKLALSEERARPGDLPRDEESTDMMNEWFLQILYEQYLRYISESRSKRRRNLVVLDMSGSKEENFQTFLRLFDQTTGRSL